MDIVPDGNLDAVASLINGYINATSNTGVSIVESNFCQAALGVSALQLVRDVKINM